MTAGRSRRCTAASIVRDVLAVVFSRPALRRCIPTALVVGSLLSAINQGTVIKRGDTTAATWIRVAFNYLIPFIVSNVGFCSAVFARRRTDEQAR